jgi:hypothetical protein
MIPIESCSEEVLKRCLDWFADQAARRAWSQTRLTSEWRWFRREASTRACIKAGAPSCATPYDGFLRSTVRIREFEVFCGDPTNEG